MPDDLGPAAPRCAAGVGDERSCARRGVAARLGAAPSHENRPARSVNSQYILLLFPLLLVSWINEVRDGLLSTQVAALHDYARD